MTTEEEFCKQIDEIAVRFGIEDLPAVGNAKAMARILIFTGDAESIYERFNIGRIVNYHAGGQVITLNADLSAIPSEELYDFVTRGHGTATLVLLSPLGMDIATSDGLSIWVPSYKLPTGMLAQDVSSYLPARRLMEHVTGNTVKLPTGGSMLDGVNLITAQHADEAWSVSFRSS